MAEQNIDETKRAAARRAARPFTGPPGTPSPAQAPILRPAGPANRPARGPFAPPGGRAALGSASVVAQPAAAPVTAPSDAVGSTVTGDAFAPHATAPAAPPAPVSPAAVTFDPGPSESVGGAAITTPAVPSDTRAAHGHAAALAGAESPDLGEAFDRIGDVWETEPGLDTPAMHAESPLLDEASLGMGADATEAWADEITALPDPWTDAGAAAPADPADALEPDIDWAAAPEIPSADDVVAAGPPSQAAAAVEEERAHAVEPGFAETLDEALALPEVLAAEPARVPWPDPLLAEYAPYVPAPEVTDGADVHAEGVVAAEPESPAVVVAEVESPGPELRVAEALDRLAERVRRGEIPVSSVAPEATDAAVLASVLVALLGGPISR